MEMCIKNPTNMQSHELFPFKKHKSNIVYTKTAPFFIIQSIKAS